MNKGELVERVAELASVTKKDAGKVLDATLTAIGEAVANGDTVSLADFGKFEARQRKGRTGRNPQTGDALDIAAKVVPAFQAFARFKKLVNR